MLIGYARVSTAGQDVGLQVDALRAAGADKIMVEHASGADRDRPVLRQCLSELRPGDGLIAWKLDRIARSLSHLLDIVSLLSERGCSFRSLTEALSTENAQGRLVLHIFAALAEFERELIRERVIAGLDHARATGKVLGPTPKLSPALISCLRSRARNGESIKALAKEVGVSPRTLSRHGVHSSGSKMPSSD